MAGAEPRLRVVGGTDRKRAPTGDAQGRALLKRRAALKAQLLVVEAELFAHRRRKATERGQVPPLTLDQLIAELGIAR
jgi:hypothetical protein